MKISLKKMKIKRMIPSILLASMLLGAVSCAQPTADDTKSNGETVQAVTEETTVDTKLYDGLPDTDYEGAAFNIAIYENANASNHVLVEEQTGEVMNDAMYTRQSKLEDRFKVDLEEIVFNDFSGWVRTTTTAGDAACHIAQVRCTEALSYWQEGILIQTGELPVINLDKEYWSKALNESLSLGGNQYIAMGAFNLSTYDLTFALLFNKDMITNYTLSDPYALVNNGSWTYDAMAQMMTAVMSDINGDGKMDGSDNYGYLAHFKNVLPNFWIAAGEMAVKKDDSDIPYLAMDGERFYSVFNRIFEIMRDTGVWYQKSQFDKDIPTDCVTMFSAGQSIFLDCTMFYIASLRDMDTDFGILPYPKNDDTQDEYYARVSYYNPTVIPITNTELELTGTMLEALMCESYNTVVPAYYEVALKAKYSRDNESQAMLDLIMKRCVVDIGDTTLCDKIRDDFMASMFKTDNRNLASKVASTEKIIQQFIDKLPIEEE